MSTQVVLDAIEHEDADALRAALASEPAAASARDAVGVSAVLLARYRSRTDLIEILRAAGPQLDVFDAAGLGDVERLRALLDAEPGAAQRRSADGFTPLHLAAFFDHEQAARLLVEHGADVDAVAANSMRVTPLHSAAAGRATAICRLLVERGADVNARQEGGFMPLHAAAQNGDMELAQLLLDRRADRTARTDDGRTPADFVADDAPPELVRVLRA